MLLFGTGAGDMFATELLVRLVFSLRLRLKVPVPDAN